MMSSFEPSEAAIKLSVAAESIASANRPRPFSAGQGTPLEARQVAKKIIRVASSLNFPSRSGRTPPETNLMGFRLIVWRVAWTRVILRIKSTGNIR